MLHPLGQQRKIIINRLLANYEKEFELLIKAGKLTKKDGWWNVVEHCFEEMLIADALSDLFDLSMDKPRFMQAAICHDWDKRIEVRPTDFSEKDIDYTQKLLKEICPDKDLLFATKYTFIEYALILKKSTFLQRLLYFIDNSTLESQFVGYKKRIKETRRRSTEHDHDEELIAKLGGKYWDKELELAGLVEKEVLYKLRKKGIKITSGNKLPQLLYQTLNKKYS